MIKTLRILALCLPLLLGGCIQNPFRVEIPAQNYAVDYYLWLKSSTPETLQQEIEKLDQEKNTMHPDVRAVRMALLLTITEDVTREDEKLALQLLQQTMDTTTVSPVREIHDYQQFALIWKDVIEQRRELEGSIDHLSENLTQKQKVIQILREENAAYSKKIEALKLIEQQINDREQSHDNSPETETFQ